MRISNYILLAEKFFIKRDPIQVTHFVTSRCNARCKHCFYWNDLNLNKNELKLEEIKNISKSMPNFFFLIISGGEPFLRSDLGDIIKTYYLNNNIGNLTIPTNGFLTDSIYNTSKEILDSCPDLFFTVSLSIDGIGKDHDEIRGVSGLFEKLEKTYWKLNDLKKSYKNFNVDFLTTLSKLNQEKLEQISSYINKTFNNDINVSLVRGNPKEHSIKEIDIRFYDNILDFQKNRFDKLSSFNQSKLKVKVRKIMHNLRHEFISRTFKEGKYLIPCYACKLDVVINEEGDVYPCETLGRKIGNLRDYGYDFKKLWHSKKANEIRQFIKSSRCFCTHECNIRTNILFNPYIMMKGLIR